MKKLLNKIFKRQSKIIDVQKRKLSDYDLLYFNSLVEVISIYWFKQTLGISNKTDRMM